MASVADINDCLGDPCQNQGTCVDGINGFQCICREGWEGTFCHISESACTSAGIFLVKYSHLVILSGECFQMFAFNFWSVACLQTRMTACQIHAAMVAHAQITLLVSHASVWMTGRERPVTCVSRATFSPFCAVLKQWKQYQEFHQMTWKAKTWHSSIITSLTYSHVHPCS